MLYSISFSDVCCIILIILLINMDKVMYVSSYTKTWNDVFKWCIVWTWINSFKLLKVFWTISKVAIPLILLMKFLSNSPWFHCIKRNVKALRVLKTNTILFLIPNKRENYPKKRNDHSEHTNCACLIQSRLSRLLLIHDVQKKEQNIMMNEKPHTGEE